MCEGAFLSCPAHCVLISRCSDLRVPLLLCPMEKGVHRANQANGCFRLVGPHQHCICLAALQWPRLTYHVSLDSNFVLQIKAKWLLDWMGRTGSHLKSP